MLSCPSGSPMLLGGVDCTGAAMAMAAMATVSKTPVAPLMILFNFMMILLFTPSLRNVIHTRVLPCDTHVIAGLACSRMGKVIAVLVKNQQLRAIGQRHQITRKSPQKGTLPNHCGLRAPDAGIQCLRVRQQVNTLWPNHDAGTIQID